MESDQGYTVSTVRRRRRRKPSPEISDPRAVYDLVHPLVRDKIQEHFYVLYLNGRNRLLSLELVSVGTLNASIVHPRDVFRPAILQGCNTVLVVHNHPSGETDPSEDDLAITRRLGEAGELLGIQLLDHVIVANGSFTSLKEERHL